MIDITTLHVIELINIINDYKIQILSPYHGESKWMVSVRYDTDKTLTEIMDYMVKGGDYNTSGDNLQTVLNDTINKIENIKLRRTEQTHDFTNMNVVEFINLIDKFKISILVPFTNYPNWASNSRVCGFANAGRLGTRAIDLFDVIQDEFNLIGTLIKDVGWFCNGNDYTNDLMWHKKFKGDI